MVALADAFFFSVSNSHLWVVISPPDGPRNEFVMVNMTTLDEKVFDESCVLDPADYPVFIKRPTVIYYADVKLWWVDGDRGYDELAASQQITTMPTLSPHTLLRIQQGALKSDFFPPDYIHLVQDNLITMPVPAPHPVPIRPIPVRPASPLPPRRFPLPPAKQG
ncbi:MAG: hypothetical protein ACLQVX_02760 [Limisphaerales bacterium]